MLFASRGGSLNTAIQLCMVGVDLSDSQGLPTQKLMQVSQEDKAKDSCAVDHLGGKRGKLKNTYFSHFLHPTDISICSGEKKKKKKSIS